MRKLVMIIDDSRTVRKLLEVTLKRAEIKTVCYADGTEALCALKTQPELVPALIFLDVRLPDMDGYAIARLLRSDSRFDMTTIILLSGHDGIVERFRGRLAGATTYMTKPFKTREILATVSRYLPILAVGDPLQEAHRRGQILPCILPECEARDAAASLAECSPVDRAHAQFIERDSG